MPLGAGLSIQCTACGADAKLTSHFDLDVQNYKLQLLDMSFTGSASFNVAALLSATLTKTWAGKTANPAFAKRPRTGGSYAEKQQQPELEGGTSSPATQHAME